MGEDVKITFRGTEDYRDSLQRAALDRRIKVQELITRAIGAYLADPATRQATPRQPQAPEGFEYVLIRKEAVPLIESLVSWIENDGRDKVLAALDAGLARFAGGDEVSSDHDRARVPGKPEGARKLKPAQP